MCSSGVLSSGTCSGLVAGSSGTQPWTLWGPQPLPQQGPQALAVPGSTYSISLRGSGLGFGWISWDFGVHQLGEGGLEALPLLCHPHAGQGVKPHGPAVPFPFHHGDF